MQQLRNKKGRTSPSSSCQCRWAANLAINTWEGHPLYATGVAAVDPSVAPPKIVAKLTPSSNVSNYPRRLRRTVWAETMLIANLANATMLQMNWRRSARTAKQFTKPVHCLRRRFSIASFVLASDAACPVTLTGVPLQTPHMLMHNCINSTPLSADNVRCQAHFFFTTFCVARPLAEIVARCSAHDFIANIVTQIEKSRIDDYYLTTSVTA